MTDAARLYEARQAAQLASSEAQRLSDVAGSSLCPDTDAQQAAWDAQLARDQAWNHYYDMADRLSR